ncbi:PHP domain-containing protein [candidate division KSB1 bacterium]|nr:PHP domain-containing protein [candidate division KSB1 bacterium]
MHNSSRVSDEDGLADLHIHTNNSDGDFTPAEIVEKAVAAGLQAISITDHDAIAGISEAQKIAKSYDLEVIAGIELSCVEDENCFHMLGYFIDINNKDLQNYIKLLQTDRFERAQKIIIKLSNLGIDISLDVVLEKAGPGAIGRPHIAEILLEEGYVLSFEEAFARFLGYDKPAFVQNYPISSKEAMELIHTAGGISFLAHPQPNLNENQLEKYIEDGLDGLEIHHPRFSEADVSKLYNLAINYDLLVSGGSDFHTIKNGECCLGKKSVPYRFVEDMKCRLISS